MNYCTFKVRAFSKRMHGFMGKRLKYGPERREDQACKAHGPNVQKAITHWAMSMLGRGVLVSAT
jgi:hypothetical protein